MQITQSEDSGPPSANRAGFKITGSAGLSPLTCSLPRSREKTVTTAMEHKAICVVVLALSLVLSTLVQGRSGKTVPTLLSGGHEGRGGLQESLCMFWGQAVWCQALF